MSSDASFPKSARIRAGPHFRALIARGEVFPGRECLVRRLANGGKRPRLGISAPRRYGNAVRRNRFRRLVREAFRRRTAALTGYDYFVSPRRGLREPTLHGLEQDLLSTRTRRPVPRRSLPTA